MTISVVAIDDNSLAMRGAVDTARKHDLFVFDGCLDTCADLPDRCVESPAVLLIDPFSEAHDICDLISISPAYATLVMSATTDIDSVRGALRCGARGFISKESSTTTLLNAISAVGVGGMYLGNLLDRMLQDHAVEFSAAPTLPDGLTPREREVIVMVAQGLTHKQIGLRLKLSKATIDTYIHRVRQKVGSGNKADLTRLAIDLGLVETSPALSLSRPAAGDQWR